MNSKLGVTQVDEVCAGLAECRLAGFWTIARNVWLFLLAAWLFVIYLPAMKGPFVFDDLGNLVGNPIVENFPPRLNWVRAESRPLVFLSFSFEHALFGANPAVHRIGNLIIHCVTAWLLAELTLRLVTVTHAASARAAHIAIALSVATFWAVHPLQTQAISYIVQRCESLMGMFFLAFLLAIVLHHRTDQRRWLVIGVLCFVGGLLSKTVMVTGLIVGPLLDRAWLCNSWREVLSRRAVLYMPPIIAGGIAIATLLPGILRGDANVGFGGDAPAVLPYLAAEAKTICQYALMVVIPRGQNIDHGLVAPIIWQQYWPWIAGVFLTVCAGVVLSVRGHWKAGFLILTPLLILSPTSSIIPTADVMVEHRMYLPLAAIVAGILWVVMTCLDRFAPLSARTTSIVVVTLVIVLSWLTWNRNRDYSSGTRLWYASLLANPANARAAQNLANAAREESRNQDLLPMFISALDWARANDQPTAIVLGRIGEELVKQGLGARAVAPLRQAVAADPSMSELRSRFHTPSQLQEFASHHISLALALMQVGQSSPAAEHLRQSFAISDVSPDARAIAGDLAWQMGDSNEAIEHFERALQLRPQWPDVQTQLERIRQNLQVQYRSAL